MREPFEKFLVWLSADRDLALKKHDEIMRRIKKYFVRKGCPESEELAGDTRDRVIRIISKGGQYPNSDALFFSVADKIWKEYKRKPKPDPLPEDDLLTLHAQDTRAKELLGLCLERCLDQLPALEKSFIQHYYEAHTFKAKKLLLAEHGEESTRRVKAFRIRAKLRTCIKACMAELEK